MEQEMPKQPEVTTARSSLADSISALLEVRGVIMKSRARVVSDLVASLADVGQSIIENRARVVRASTESDSTAKIRQACSDHLEHVAGAMTDAAAEIRTAAK